MKKISLFLGEILMLVLTLPAFAITCTYTSIDYPGAERTWANDINDRGQIAGFIIWGAIGSTHMAF